MAAATSIARSETPVFKRAVIAGLALFALSMLGEALGYGLSGDLAGALVHLAIGVSALVLAFLVLRFGAWALALSVVLTVVGWFFFEGYATAFELSHPESFFDFMPNLVALVGTLIAIAGGAVAIRQLRSRDVRLTALPAERAALGALTFVLVAIASTSAGLTMASRESVSPQAEAGAALVKMRTLKFSPDRIAVASGEPLKLVVNNDDPSLHTFTMDDLDIDFELGPGSERLVELPALDPGSYEFYCAVEGHESMTGTLEVQ